MALDLVAGRASLEVRALSRTVLGWRTKRGWSLAELGELVGFSAAKLSQLCRAVLRMPPLEVVAIGAACGASDDEVELCVRVAQRAADSGMLLRTLRSGDTWLESAAERDPYGRALVALDGVFRSQEESVRWLSEAALRLRDPLSGNDSGVQQRHLQMVADRAGS